MKEFQNYNSSNNKKVLVSLAIDKIEDLLLNECLYSLAQQQYSIDLLILAKNLSDSDMELLKKYVSNPTISINKKDENGQVTYEDVQAIKSLNYIIEETNANTFNQVFNEAFNYSVKNNYEWFSMIEYDDITDVKWYNTFKYFSENKTDIDGYLPITREISNGVFLGFFNEASWVDGFAEVAGTYDLSLLLRFNCMNLTGSVFKTESIKNLSEYNLENDYYMPIKESIKINYIYEFFLRMIYSDLKFYTIPRIGYEHRIDRPTNSVNYFTSKTPRDIVNIPVEKGGINSEEQGFWAALAKKEYYYPNDRKIAFTTK